MRYAIIEDGGKQYRVSEGDFVDVDLFQSEIGEQIDLDHVLLISDEKEILVGNPHVSHAKIEATVVKHIKAPKVVVFKYKPKERYRVKSGHRQRYTRLRVDKIICESGGNNGS